MQEQMGPKSDLGTLLKRYGMGQMALSGVEFILIILALIVIPIMEDSNLNMNNEEDIDIILQNGGLLAVFIIMLILFLFFAIGIFGVLVLQIRYLKQLSIVVKETSSRYLRNIFICEIAIAVCWGIFPFFNSIEPEPRLYIFASISNVLALAMIPQLKKWVGDFSQQNASEEDIPALSLWLRIRMGGLALGLIVFLFEVIFGFMGLVGMLIGLVFLAVAAVANWQIGYNIESIFG
ncbi:MAG: hypothetical protein ACTSYI_10725 [Promethearchaeota archaeon]